MSPSLRGRGLKFECAPRLAIFDVSPSLRGRGLKSKGLSVEYHDVFKSPSLRGRGLKLILTLCAIINVSVALFARAWIEIISVTTYE